MKAGVLKEICIECGQTNKHNGKKLVLQLDHINGDNNDYRIENLRILCPNCHSQTNTFAGKNQKERRINSSERASDSRINSRLPNISV